MKILLLGAKGQVGWELARFLPALGDVVAWDQEECDFADLEAVRRSLHEVGPDVLVNAAAYTAVDRAESERGIAHLVNAEAPGVMAEVLKRTGGLLVHYSTDYVFDGTKPAPYTEQDEPNPVNVYGKTKLDGELAIQESGVAHLIFRTSWVYGARGGNFLLTMLRLFDERPELKIVADQIGAPTWCRYLARQTVEAIRIRLAHVGQQPGSDWDGIYHMTAGGAISWHGFASAIRERRYGEAAKQGPRLIPIGTAEYPTPAKRPLNSVLSNAKLKARFALSQTDWASLLTECMSELTDSAPAKHA